MMERTSGVYVLLSPEDRPTYFVVPADPAEADLTPLSEEDRQKLTKLLGLQFDDGEQTSPLTVRRPSGKTYGLLC
ncbi:MAG UNVERIFIED_CONTAM: hypothetical protein LVQ98_05420 [Rickettsiaceae bacterium]|jgi:hypothetical protein